MNTANILQMVQTPLPSAYRQVLSKLEKWFKATSGTSEDPDAYLKLSRECKSLADGIASRDAGEEEWTQLCASVIDILSDDDEETDPIAKQLASTFSEADLASLSDEMADALRAKKHLISYSSNVRSMPKAGDTSAFKILRMPVIPLASGFVDVAQLEKSMSATNLDGRYFVLPNQLIVAINTKKILSPTPISVPNLKEEGNKIVRDLRAREAAEVKEVEAKMSTLKVAVKKQLFESTLLERKKALHAALKKEMQDEVAAYRGSNYDKFEERVNAIMKSVKAPQDLPSKHHAEWREAERKRIEQMERVAYDEDVEQYSAKIAKRYKAKFTKMSVSLEADLRAEFSKPTDSFKQQLLDSEISKVRLKYASLIEDELSQLKAEVEDAKRRNKAAKDPSNNSADKLDTVVSAMEHKLNRSLTVMPGLSKYKASGFLYYWVCDDTTLSKLRSAFKGSLVIERWGFPF